jgi:hypothetical protein
MPLQIATYDTYISSYVNRMVFLTTKVVTAFANYENRSNPR